MKFVNFIHADFAHADDGFWGFKHFGAIADFMMRQKKEIQTLQNLGLESYEIDYLVQLKKKSQMRKKWKN